MFSWLSAFLIVTTAVTAVSGFSVMSGVPAMVAQALFFVSVMILFTVLSAVLLSGAKQA